MTSIRHTRKLGIGVIAVAMLTTGVVAQPASATAGCDTTSPGLSVTVTCNAAGTESIAVPVGANAVTMTVTGAGGAGGAFGGAFGAGGDGAVITGTTSLPTGTTALAVTVGAGGTGATGINRAGGGGGGSAAFALDSGAALLSELAVAGGGGGGGGSSTMALAPNDGDGGDAGTSNTAAGGDGVDGGYPGFYLGEGGTGGGTVVGGVGGTNNQESIGGTANGGDGGDYVAGTVAVGGAGADSSGTLRGGGGGGGYTGGGGGGAGSISETTPGVWNQSAGGGGGAGRSYADPVNFADAAFAPATSGAGVGSAGVNSGGTSAGADGVVILTFEQVSPTIEGVSPATGPAAGGTEITITGTGFLPGTTVTVGGVACVPTTITAVSLTCTTGAHAAGSTDVVVSNPGSVSATSAGAFAYQAPPPDETKTCPLTVTGARKPSSKLPLNKRVTLVKKMTTVPECDLAIRQTVRQPRGDTRKGIVLRVNSTTGKITAIAYKRKASAKIRVRATAEAAPYTVDSAVWTRTWRS